ncbi:paeninodin family lasso peptide [Peribacillus asahii]
MKKEWNSPELEVLDVNQTMLGQDGDSTDAAFPAGTKLSDITTS